MCENRVLREKSGAKVQGVTGYCRRLHEEEVNVLYVRQIVIGLL